MQTCTMELFVAYGDNVNPCERAIGQNPGYGPSTTPPFQMTKIPNTARKTK